MVIIGHVGGLVIPKSWTDAVGVIQELYHVNALLFGGIAGVCTLVGIVILVYRRRTTGPVFMATTQQRQGDVRRPGRRDRRSGSGPPSASAPATEAHNYRETVSPWFRSLFVLQPDVRAMAAAPLAFQVHALVGMLLFAIWPFTRLVHAFTAPLHYLFRPYIVYRSRDRPGARRRPPPRLGAGRHPRPRPPPLKPTRIEAVT